MAFRGLLWFWKNAFGVPLQSMGTVGRILNEVLFPVLVHLRGIALADVSFLL